MAYFNEATGHYVRKSQSQRRKERHNKMIAKAIINTGAMMYYIIAGAIGGTLIPLLLSTILNTNIVPWNVFGIYTLVGMFLWLIIMRIGAIYGRRIFTRVVDFMSIYFGGKE